MKTITVNQTIRAVLYLFLPVTIGMTIVSMPGLSAGAWMRGLAPSLSLGILLVLFQTSYLSISWAGWKSILARSARKDLTIDIKLIFVLLITAIIVSFFLLIYSRFGLTIIVGMLLAGIGLVTSFVFIITERRAAGISFMIVTLSIVNFLEFQFRVYYKAYHGVFFVMPTIIIMWIMAVLFLFRHLKMKQAFVNTAFNKIWLMVFIPMVLSAIFSSDRIISLRHVIYFISTSIPFFLMVNSVKTIEEFKLCSLCLAWAAALRVITVLYFEIGKGAAGFAYGSVAHCNLPSYTSVLGMGTLLCFFLSLGLLMGKRLRLKEYCIIILLVLFLIIVLLKSPRSVDLGLVLGLFVLLLFYRRFVVFSILAILASTLFLFWPFIMQHTALGRFADFITIESLLEHQRMRVDAWQAACSMMRDYPLFGIGPGMWDKYFFMYVAKPVSWFVQGIPTIQYIRGAHNIYLQYAAICGIPGLISICLLSVIMVKELLTGWRRAGAIKEFSAAFLAVTISFWTMATLGGVSFEISHSPEEHVWFWLFVGLIGVFNNIQK